MTLMEVRLAALTRPFHRHFIPTSVLAILLGVGLARSQAADSKDVAELAVSCQVTWSSTTSWGKELKDSEDQPYRLAIAANETVHLDNDTRFQRRDGSWEEVESRVAITVDGSGTYSSSGKNPISKTVGSFAREPVPTEGLARLSSVDFEQGYAILTVTRPVTEVRPECIECGFIAIAALTDCLSTINTNATPAPKEYRIEFPPGTAAFTASQSFNWSQTGACGSDSIAVTISLAYTPGQWEAVIIPPPDFDQWLPAGGVDADTPGSSLGVSIQLRHKGETEPATDMTGTFYVTLEGVSRQPGICVNAPPKDQAGTDPDLRLQETEELWLAGQDGLEGQSYEDSSELSVTIEGYDFGAYGRLRVEVVVNDGTTVQAHLEGDSGRDYLDLPEDANGNRIADGWEKDHGVEELPGKWDEADLPAGHHTLGDGLSLYEKYRGFVLKGYHQRLEPHRKHLFVYDPTGLALLSTTEPDGVNFITALDCEVVFLDPVNWTGVGSAGSGKRIVNFNSTDDVHAVDQHGLHLRFPFTANPTEPADYREQFLKKYGTNSTDTLEWTFGCAYPDFGTPSGLSPGAWLGIETYANNIDMWTRRVAWYHSYALPEFASYANPGTPAAERTRMDALARERSEEYIRDHHDDFEKRNWLHLTSTLTHEIGHGVGIDDLSPPNSGGPKECVMRYFSESEFPRKADDRFELGLRNPWPHVYCRSAVGTVSGIACWGQISVSDRADAPRAPAVAAAPRRAGFPSGEVSRAAASPGTLLDEAPALVLTPELVWDETLAGDPLRVEITLSCAAYQQALLLAARTGTGVPATLLHPTIATNWEETVSPVLYRIGDDSRWQEVLARDAWKSHLRPLAVSPEAFGKKPLARVREWLVAPEAAALTPGDYVLSVLWDGDGLVEEEALPRFGNVSARNLSFTVRAITNEVQRAHQEYRLAFQAYTKEDYAQAWRHAQAALEVVEARLALESQGIRLLAANTALKLGDYRGAVASLQTARPDWRGEPAAIALGLRRVLAPELSLDSESVRLRTPRLTVTALPAQSYEVQASDNLASWIVLDRRLAETNRYEVADPGQTGPHPRFYRVVWLP